MRRAFHICVSSSDEVMFRTGEDYVRGMNCMALALYGTGSSLLADSFMSNHFHLAVQTDDKTAFVKSLRIAYGKYFNTKYHRSGPLGEEGFFDIELDGVYHYISAISYILRNCVHHGICHTPFEYEYNSANCYFRKQLGHLQKYDYLTSTKDIHKYISKNSSLPPGYKMDSSGLIVQEQYIEAPVVEKWYVTPRSFLYNMNRLSTEEWTREQEKDIDSQEPITLEAIEQGTRNSLPSMLQNEKGRFNTGRISDMEVCKLIDGYFVPRINKESYTQLSDSEKEVIAKKLVSDYSAGTSQVRRCLAMR